MTDRQGIPIRDVRLTGPQIEILIGLVGLAEAGTPEDSGLTARELAVATRAGEALRRARGDYDTPEEGTDPR